MQLNRNDQWFGCFIVLTLLLGVLGQNFTEKTAEDDPKSQKIGKGKNLLAKFAVFQEYFF